MILIQLSFSLKNRLTPLSGGKAAWKINMDKACASGISLVEVLLCLTLLSLSILPFTLLLGQSMQTGRGVYLQSTRGIFLSSAADQMDASRPDYTQQFNDSSKNNTLSESGQFIPYQTTVDTSTASDSFKRTAYLYSYNTTSDPTNSPRYKLLLYNSSPVYRLRCGNSSAFIDSSNQEWVGDAFSYDATKKQPGYVTGSSGTTGSNVVNILNATAADDPLFQYYREGTGSTNVDYSFDVPNGAYTVFLYFAELNPSVTGSAPNRRLMDIYLEGSLQNSTAYSPFETTGGAYLGNIQYYDVTVSNNVLNVSIRRNASSNYDARISGIVLKKRLIQ